MPIIETPQQPKQVHRGSPEGKIQAQCVQWLWNNYPEYRMLYFAIPNENSRSDSNPITGAIRRSMGVCAGVADTFLSIPNSKYHGLYIEFKSAVGRQRKEQMAFEAQVARMGYRYELVRDFETFKKIVLSYLVD